MTRKRIRVVLLGLLCLLMSALSVYTLINAERHFGEYILYSMTALLVLSFVSCIKGLNSHTWVRLRSVTKIIFICFAAGFALLMFACRTDKVSYSEKYVIVLGAPVRETHISKILDSRIEAAADFLEKDTGAVAVLTGGNSPYEDVSRDVSEVTTEGAYMTMAIVAAGIAPERLYLEDEAETTDENFVYSTELLRDAGYTDGERIVIITNRFHAFRVRQIAKEAGLANLAVFAASVAPAEAVTWYLREIPVSAAFIVRHELLNLR